MHGIKPPFESLMPCSVLIGGNAVTEYLVVSHGIVILPTSIARVALNSVNNAVLDSFDDTCMI